ncbi:hypothetical protein BOX15_Mlig023084g1 [Macrostomum lignano]|uniref:RING-type domain-containing protein n=2 Tax=Macrostomum lignano TaxID=282301 RepID=A0A267FUQ7_9PLAT|nr:hypothetical protein BOX15_Mlig023084g1 [Macrostomum lignano]
MSTPDDSNSCLVCREECQYYGIGECNHTVCAKCAIRLKVICKVAECPICRHKSSQILITKSHSKYNCFQTDKFMSLPDEDLLFENQEVLTYYTDLISYTCSDCGLQCNSMSALKRHVNNDHKKRFCLICVEHLKLFPREHELFDDGSLSEHKRWRAERPNHGHPKCQICQESFYDAELWYNHLRRQHFMCHICENLPTLERFHQQRTVYGNYEQLNKHFIASHYVCQEGPCQSDQFTNVFATENELRAHKISHHSGVMDKALLRETRRLDVDIRYQRRGASGVNSGPSGSRGGGGGSGSGVGPPATSHMPTAREALDQLVSLAPGVREFAANALAQSAAAQRELDANGYAENPEEFPTLTGETQTKFVGRQAAKATEEDFPSLPSASSTAPAATEASSQQQQQQQVPPPPVYSGPRRMPAAIPFTSLVSGNNAPPSSAANLEEEYPTLGRPVGSASAASNSIWGPPSATSSSSASKPNISSNANKKVKKPPPSTSSANDFPSLPQPSGPPPQPSAVAKPTPKPRTRPPTAPPQPQKPTAAPEASKQQQQPPPPPPDPVEYRPAPNLRYQQLGSGGGGAASVALQPDEPTVYRPMNSIACVSFDSLHQQQPAQQKKQEKFSLVEDFPGLPAPASSAPIAARNNNTTKSSNSAKNRFAALNDSSPIDLVGDGDDWSEWPAAVSQQKQQQQQQQKSLNFKQKSTAGAVFSGQMDDFPTLGGPSSSSGASAAPVWRKDGRSQPKQQQEKYLAPSTPLGLSASAQSVAGGKKQKKKQQKQQQEKKQLELQSDSTASQQQQKQQPPPPRNASWCDLLVREQYTYSPPEGLLQRQGQLLERLQACLADQEKFTGFAKASSEYLQGQLEPEQFLSKAVNLLGGKQWRLIAADLISTLPSISRQRDLRKRLPDELRSALAVCDTCAQTLLPEDLDGHRCMQIEE